MKYCTKVSFILFYFPQNLQSRKKPTRFVMMKLK